MNNLQLKITDPLKQISGTQDIANHYSDSQKSKIANAAKEFEGLLTSMMLKSMTKTTDGMFGSNSYGGDDFDTIFQNEIASFISKKKSLGIADILYKKITGENMDSSINKISNEPLNNIIKNAAPSENSENAAKIITTGDGNNNIKSRELEPPKQAQKKDSKPNIKVLPSISPSSKALERLDRYQNIIDNASNIFGVDQNVIKSVILTESAANDKALSGAKAKGLMQLIDSTANDMGVKNIWDPKQNIYGGTKYLAEMLRKYNGNLNLALASYNAGPQNVDKYGGIPPFEETKNYVKRVVGYLNHLNGEKNGTDQSI
jgi:Rod binding domain-containing protein